MPAGARIVLVCEDDDVSGPLEAALRGAGHRVEVVDGAGGAELLRSAPPDLLVLDRDLPAAAHQAIADLLAARATRESFPLLVLGRKGTPEYPPPRWDEDACLILPRPPEPAAFGAAAQALLRLAFYRPYRDLVHDLAQPVTTLHALSRSIARHPPADEAARQAVERLGREAERLMTLLEQFQRRRAPGQ